MAKRKRRIRRSLHRQVEPRSRRTRLLGVALGAGVVLLLVFALVFSIAFGTQQVAAHAGALHDADEALRAATVVRAQTGMAAHLADLERGFGLDTAEATALAAAEAEVALTDLRGSIGGIGYRTGGLDPRLANAAAGFETAAAALLARLTDGDPAPLEEAVAGLDVGYRELVGAVVVERDYQASQVAAANASMGRIGDVVRFLVAFLVPALVILLYRELSHRQRRQSELEVRLEAEQELGKARDEFVASASHELRTPLTSIFGLAHILEEDEQVAASTTAAEMVGMIISEAHDLNRMVEDLLTTARIDAGALHYQFEALPVLYEVHEVVDPMARTGNRVEIDVHPALVKADRLRLRQVIRNLLSNAAKYGGDDVRVVGRVVAGWYEVIVADDGEGIPAELEERLFQRYLHQGDMPLVLGSVGLGLSIVRALAEGMGGAVWYERDGGWSKFVVRMPLAEATGETRFREPDLTRRRRKLGSPGEDIEIRPEDSAVERRVAAPVPGSAQAAAEQLRRLQANRRR